MGIAYGPLFGVFALFVWFKFIVSFIIYGIEFLMAFNDMELRQKIEAMQGKK
jgi:membrane protein